MTIGKISNQNVGIFAKKDIEPNALIKNQQLTVFYKVPNLANALIKNQNISVFYPTKTPIGPPWIFYDPLDDCYAVTNGTQAEIFAKENHNLNSSNLNAPRILQECANIDFTITIKIDSILTTNGQGIGFVVENDHENFLKFEVGYNSGIIITIASYTSSIETIISTSEVIAEITFPLYFKINRAESAWTCQYSLNNTSWITADTFTNNIVTNAAGLFVSSTTGHFIGLFDYFDVDGNIGGTSGEFNAIFNPYKGTSSGTTKIVGEFDTIDGYKDSGDNNFTFYSLISSGFLTIVGDVDITYNPYKGYYLISTEIVKNTFIFSGGKLTVLSNSDFTGALNIFDVSKNVKIQGTKDYYHLSPDLGTFEENYFPYGKSDISLTKVDGDITLNGVINIFNKSIEFRPIALSYLKDFYYRIHFYPNPLDLGNVISAQEIELHIWNSFFTNQNLNSLSSTNLPDVSIEFNETFPYTFKPLENYIAKVIVKEFGVPEINGKFNFSFAIGNYNVKVFGKRAILWPFPPKVEHTETRKWLTDVIKTKTSESIYEVRDFPRLDLTYSFSFKDREDWSNAISLANKFVQFAIAMPYWSTATLVIDIFSGNDTINIETTWQEFELNQPILLFKSYKEYEVKIIKEIFEDKIVLTSKIINNFEKCYLMPVFLGNLENGITFNEDVRQVKTGSLKFLTSKVYFDPDYYVFKDFYKGLPVLDSRIVLSIGREFSRDQEFFDSVIGNFTKNDIDFYNQQKTNFIENALTLKDKFILKRKIDYFKGRLKYFFVSTLYDNIFPLNDILINTNVLLISTETWSTHVPRYVRITGTKQQCFEINQIVDNGNGTSTIQFIENAVETITEIKTVEILTIYRFNNDNIEFSYPDKTLMTVNVPLIEKPNE